MKLRRLKDDEWLYQNTGASFVTSPANRPGAEYILGAWPMPRPAGFQNFSWVQNEDFDYGEIPGLCDRYAGRAILYGVGALEAPSLVGAGELLRRHVHPADSAITCAICSRNFFVKLRRAYKAATLD
jgi:hypothetical protein